MNPNASAATSLPRQRFLYDPGSGPGAGSDALVAEYTDGGSMTGRYVHGVGADTPYAWYTGSTVTAASRRHLFANWQGSISLITNATGFTVLGINAYDAYGIPNATNIGRFQYTGQIWLPELGMYHYKARMMSPTLGRFMQTDPIGYNDGMNWYNYVGSDPLNYVDPTGLAGQCVYPAPNGEREDCEKAGGTWVEDDESDPIIVNGCNGALVGNFCLSAIDFDLRNATIVALNFTLEFLPQPPLPRRSDENFGQCLARILGPKDALLVGGSLAAIEAGRAQPSLYPRTPFGGSDASGTSHISKASREFFGNEKLTTRRFRTLSKGGQIGRAASSASVVGGAAVLALEAGRMAGAVDICNGN